jgi:LAO/AO transport system ATPase
VTGPPGVGKSTLLSALIGELRRRDLTVGVIAVDPSSPFSGGAVLGDRDRMQGFSRDGGVFIRSLASRGATGGLCAAANDAVDVLDAMGKDIVLIETVGVGQSEIEIARIANTVLLVLVPGYGDSLQAMKAGVMEIADILVVNKADSLGADGAVKDLQSMDYYQAVPEGDEMWQVPVLKTVATRGEGVAELVRGAVDARGLITQGLLSPAAEAHIQFQARLRLSKFGIVAPAKTNFRKRAFVHPSEQIFANLLDFYRVAWEYEPRSFPVQWDKDGRVLEAFTPDFYLPEFDLYVELTTMKQSLVTRKNRKVKLLRTIYPQVNIQVFYQKDFENLIFKYGLADRLVIQPEHNTQGVATR